MGEERAGKANYRDIMEYAGYLRKMYHNPESINRLLYGVKAWYFYLISTGTRTDTDRLVLTLRGSAENGEGINYLIETFKPMFPERNLNARTIRQSVITNMLREGKDLRVVQVFAGHKKISSTEEYRQSGLEELQAAINKYHPLG
jgi:site-specific recombinase XerD